jgi:uncharacterized membrane protein
VDTEPEDAAPGNEDPASLPALDRVVTLSDGVVAIALTLLVLQIAVPAASTLGRHPDSASALAAALDKSSDEWISYGISFYVIVQFWLTHHRVFRLIGKQQDGLAVWNFGFLFTITVMPFTSDLLGKDGNNPLAVAIFSLNLLLANLAVRGMLQFARRHSLLVPGRQDPGLSGVQFLAGIAVLVLSIAIAWFNPTLAKFCWLLFGLIPRAAGAVDRYRARGGGHSRS